MIEIWKLVHLQESIDHVAPLQYKNAGRDMAALHEFGGIFATSAAVFKASY